MADDGDDGGDNGPKTAKQLRFELSNLVKQETQHNRTIDELRTAHRMERLPCDPRALQRVTDGATSAHAANAAHTLSEARAMHAAQAGSAAGAARVKHSACTAHVECAVGCACGTHSAARGADS